MSLDVLAVNTNPLLNLVHSGDFSPFEVNRVPPLAMSMAAEGKGVNVARFLARHGYRVALAGFAGGFSGAWLREMVRAEGVEDSFVETAAPLRVGFMAQGHKAGHPTTVLPSGFPVTLAECKALLLKIESLLGSVRLVIASGSVPDSLVNGFYVELLNLCERRHVPCWLDAYGPAMGLALAGPVAPVLAKPNRDELVSGKHWHRVAELHITDGENPIEITSQAEGRWQVVPPLIRQVNPIGSGDCYLAALAHGWLQRFNFEDRLRYAASAGSANALKLGVATVSPAEVQALLGQVRVERLGRAHARIGSV